MLSRTDGIANLLPAVLPRGRSMMISHTGWRVQTGTWRQTSPCSGPPGFMPIAGFQRERCSGKGSIASGPASSAIQAGPSRLSTGS